MTDSMAVRFMLGNIVSQVTPYTLECRVNLLIRVHRARMSGILGLSGLSSSHKAKYSDLTYVLSFGLSSNRMRSRRGELSARSKTSTIVANRRL